jgi:hypothetical protein
MEIGFIFKEIPVAPRHHVCVISGSRPTADRARKGGSLLKINIYVEATGLR